MPGQPCRMSPASGEEAPHIQGSARGGLESTRDWGRSVGRCALLSGFQEAGTACHGVGFRARHWSCAISRGLPWAPPKCFWLQLWPAFSFSISLSLRAPSDFPVLMQPQ